MTEDQVEELMKAFAQADKVSNFINIDGVTDFCRISIITSVQVWIVTNYHEIFEDGDGILTVEEYKAAFHEHGVFVGLKTRYKSVLRILMTRRGMDKRNDEENWFRWRRNYFLNRVCWKEYEVSIFSILRNIWIYMFIFLSLLTVIFIFPEINQLFLLTPAVWSALCPGIRRLPARWWWLMTSCRNKWGTVIHHKLLNSYF